VLRIEVPHCGPPSDVVHVHVVRTPEDMEHVWDWIRISAGQERGLDIETNAKDPWWVGFRCRTVQMGDLTQAFVIVVDGDEIMEELAADAIHLHEMWVAHFAENDIAFAHRGLRTPNGTSPIRLGQAVPHVVDSQVPLAMFDPRTVSSRKGIDPRIPRLKGLKDNSVRLLGPALKAAEERLNAKFKELAPRGQKTIQASKTWGFANISTEDEDFLVYAGLDAVYGLRLYTLAKHHLTQQGRWARCVAALTEQWMVDQARLPGMQVSAEYAIWLQQQFADLLKRNAEFLEHYGIGESAGGPAVGYAFKSRGVDSPVRKKNPQGVIVESWDKNAMAELMEYSNPAWPETANEKVRELARTISSTRRAAKFKVSYVDPMVRAVALGDGAMHPSTRVIGTVTTRMSAQKTESAGPVQQLPKKDPRVRAAVRSRRGYVLVTADFEQGEPFTMAALSGDRDYLRDLEAGDINSRIAELVYGVYDPVTCPHGYDRRYGKTAGTVHYHMRQNAKAGWLLCCYGGGAAKLEQTLRQNIPAAILSTLDVRGEATLATWHSTYPVFWRYAEQRNQLAAVTLDSGHVVPLWDRFGVAADDSLFLRHDRPSRKGLNAAAQGSQADLLKLAMHRLNHGGWAWAFRFALHDELMLEVPRWMAEAARLALEAAMTITYRGVTLRCDAVIEGTTWMKQPDEFNPDMSTLDELEDEE
jgi:DNA polymerase-1